MAPSTDRQLFRAAVEAIALKAKATLPEANGRVDLAVKLVLQGDVELFDDGTAQVFSQSNGVTSYHLVGGVCDCADYERAPAQWCKHRIAAGIQKRAEAKMPQSPPVLTEPVEVPEGLEPWPDNDAEAEPEGPVEVPYAPATPAPLPEAPASVNCHIMIAGRQVQLTLRGVSEEEVLTRLEHVLQRYPLPQPPATQAPAVSQGEGWCAVHNVAMQENQKDGRRWFSHRTDEGWCKGRR